MTTAVMVHVIPRRLNFVRNLWAAMARLLHVDSTCDRCERSALECCERRGERVCILCLAVELDSRPPALAPPELAGCAAVLRQLVEELRAVRDERTATERAREDALLAVVLDVVWAITPPNLRVPSRRQIDEVLVCTTLEHYQRAWGMKTGRCTLTATFRWWQQMQARAQRYRELEEVDQKYAALVRDDLSGRTYLRRRQENVRA